MSNIGNKIKGAADTVHGIGENIRGTALGAVDTIAHDREGETRNDAIGQKGRLETQQGLERMSGYPANTTGAPTSTASDYPKHHRDDEIYNGSQAQAVYQGTDDTLQMAGAPGNVPTSMHSGPAGSYGANDAVNSQQYGRGINE
ncbi:hypothetical protein GYMLUDRAFT_279025 [Collybiopsis luxurians FD-317 M1]|nr:hypothetical protein GYMLUDRAFT_279025 [Collybiopsis luxurians FD-317 M1]